MLVYANGQRNFTIFQKPCLVLPAVVIEEQHFPWTNTACRLTAHPEELIAIRLALPVHVPSCAPHKLLLRSMSSAKVYLVRGMPVA